MLKDIHANGVGTTERGFGVVNPLLSPTFYFTKEVLKISEETL